MDKPLSELFPIVEPRLNWPDFAAAILLLRVSCIRHSAASCYKCYAPWKPCTENECDAWRIRSWYSSDYHEVDPHFTAVAKHPEYGCSWGYTVELHYFF